MSDFTYLQAQVRHSAEMCAAGDCSHAVTAKIPCRCPDCDATTFAIVARYREEQALRAAGERSETTERFALRTFDRFIRHESDELAYQAAMHVAGNPSEGLGLHGQPGVGKSHLAAAIVNACVAKNVAARFVSVDELLSKIRATFDAKGGVTEASLVRAYATVPVLVLDDLGKEALTDWTVRTLFSLVNMRYEHNLPLIVTTNFSPSWLALRSVQKGAEPVTWTSTIDRIGEMVGRWVAVEGESRR